MKAAVFYGQKRIDIEDKPVPKIGPKDALVKVGYCGICGSDRYMWRDAWIFPLTPENKPAKLPHRLENTPGHEVTGTIAELGKDVKGFNVGDKVAIYCIMYCGECYYCSKGESKRCETFDSRIMGIYSPGGYAEYMPSPARCLCKLPDDIPLDLGNLTLDTIGVPYGAFREIGVDPSKSYAIYGCGPIGLAAIKMLKMERVDEIVGVDIVDHKLDVAKHMGAKHVANAAKEDPVKFIKNRYDGVGTDIAIDAVGELEATMNVLATPKKGGMALIWGESPNLEINTSLQLIHDELNIVGTVYFNIRDHPKVVEVLRKGKDDFRKIISHIYPLEKINEAFKMFFETRETLRVLIKP